LAVFGVGFHSCSLRSLIRPGRRGRISLSAYPVALAGLVIKVLIQQPWLCVALRHRSSTKGVEGCAFV
ncbi:hypothetical protein LCGC14_1741820, partial [marine sediment metagenome]